MIRKCLLLWVIAAAAAPARGVGDVPAESVELHAHLFMEEGMTWGFHGDFFGPLEAKDHEDRFSSQASPETLRASGIRVMVVSLYAHALFVKSRREAIRRQIALARRLVAENPEWVLATRGGEAKRAYAGGKRILILALEGASGVIETDEDIAEFVDRGGIRIVTLLHLTDDFLGGAAFLRGLARLSSPFAWIRSVFSPVYDSSGEVRINDSGVTEAGLELAAKLAARGVWIDLAHAPDRAQERLIPFLKQAGQPLLYTHTVLRAHYGAERGISLPQLEAVRDTGGVVGLMPAGNMLDGTPPLGGSCGSPRPDCEGCDDSIRWLASHYAEVAKTIGPEATVFGSDFNGGVSHLPRPLCATGTPFDQTGLWNVSHVPATWRALRAAGAPVPGRLLATAERFLDAWAKVPVR